MVETGDTGRNLSSTTDGGKTWLQMESSQLPTVYGAKALSLDGQIILVAVGPKGTFFSENRGTTWQTINRDNYWGIAFTESGVGWITGPEGRITRLTIKKE